MHGQGFSDLIADAHHGIERGHRLLEDERDAGTANPPHVALGQRDEVTPFEHDAASGDAARRLEQPEDRKRGHRLAAARLADEAKCFAGRDLKAHVVHHRDGRTRALEDHAEMLDVQERVSHYAVATP